MPPDHDADVLHLLSNGAYRVAIDANGAGASRWNDTEVTRWREDPVRAPWGNFLVVADADGGAPWSVSAQPFPGAEPARADASLAGSVVFTRMHDGIDATLRVAVAADADAELRLLRLRNTGAAPRRLVVTSYLEPVLGPGPADAAHPAFSKMFVQTQWDAGRGALLAMRRRRAARDAQPWCAHFVGALADGADPGTQEFESDRRRFLGRGRALRQALAFAPGAVLDGTSGCVLDPVLCLRRRIRLTPGEECTLAFWTAIAPTREAVLALVDRLRDPAVPRATLDGAARAAQALRDGLGASSDAVATYARLAAPLRAADARWRADPAALARGRGGAPVLWRVGISGDRPIALLCLADAARAAEEAAPLLAAQRYWQAHGLAADVVLLAADAPTTSALAPVLAAHESVRAADAAQRAPSGGKQAPGSAPEGATFAFDASTLDAEVRDGLIAAARMVLDGAQGLQPPDEPSPAALPAQPVAWPAQAPRALAANQAPRADDDGEAAAREFDNGYGGFTDDGATYTIRLDGDACTPAPWCNVVANPDFGFLLSAEGGGYSWSLNSQQNPLTPWPNDPVSDVPRDAIYLRDLDDGALWTVGASPARAPAGRYECVHGQGFSRLHAEANGIAAELLLLVPVNDPVRIGRLRLRNRSARTRRLSVSAYVQWALGANGTVPAPFVQTAFAADGALHARNAWRADFDGRVAFLDLGGAQQSGTADRREFLGPLGDEAHPAGLLGDAALSGRAGAGLDPCGVLQCVLTLAPGEGVELRTLLGDADSEAAARALVERYRAADIDAVLADATGLWRDLLGSVHVRTPDRAMDIVLNHWLPYQVLACRVWGRTAYFQASGAYGFRDQLQDVMALCLSRPDLARAHILRATARQFTEGDVQHWWLPPGGTGVRTRISDDLLWLPYVAMHYIGATGDAGVLDEDVPFIEGEVLGPREDDRFFRPTVSTQSASVYEHAARTIDRSLALGAHGLPLIGTGDWNDGMNLVGEEGRGESVWLAWLLLSVIDQFAPVAQARGDAARAATWRAHADALARTLDGPAGWDGDWYRRGYYDDGSPLGSAQSDECRIDAIAQSWSVLSGRADPDKARRAMDAVHTHLTRPADGVAMLFTPPFDDGAANPGYIKGYPPGIRENGGQYTHGSSWSVFACAALGQGARATELFDIFNPILHARSRADADHYVVEPYVACADVYSAPPYVGRGGWTWYTGSSGWVWRAGIEAVLGFQRRDGRLEVDPCIRADWPGFALTHRHRGPDGRITTYEIEVDNPAGVEKGVVAISVDGAPQPLEGARVPGFAARDDGGTHRVQVRMG